MKISKNIVSIVFVLTSIMTPLFGADKIKDIVDYLKKNDAYQKATTMDKLKVINQLAKDKKISSYDKEVTKVIKTLTKEYMTEKGGNNPKARLDAYAELANSTGWKKPLDKISISSSICNVDLIIYLNNSEKYNSGNCEVKITILKELKENKKWASLYGNGELEKYVLIFIDKKTENLKLMEKYKKSLEIIAKFKKDKVLSWSNLYSRLENIYLMGYLANNNKYQALDTKGKVAFLKELEAKDLIMSFIQSDIESRIIVQMLVKDKKFMVADDKAKVAFIDDMYEKKEIHAFSKSKIKEYFGVK